LQEVPCSPPIDTDRTLDGEFMDCPGDLHISARLELVNGATIRLGGRLFVDTGGYIVAAGTADCPVRFTSLSDTPAPGDWQYMSLGSATGLPNSFTHTVFEYGGGTLDYVMSTTAPIALENVTFRHNLGAPARIQGEILKFTGVRVRHHPEDPLDVRTHNVHAIEDIALDPYTVARRMIHVTRNDPLEQSVTWRNLGVPYWIDSDFSIQGRLEIEPGTNFLVEPRRRFFVSSGGSLHFMGTEDEPIVWQSAADVPAPGDWQQIWFQSDAAPSEFHYTTLAHGGSNNLGALEMGLGTSVNLDHVTFIDNQTCDVSDAMGSANITATDSDYLLCF
jgi:hypothetical protein